MTARLAFVDLETTGLEDQHEPWEIGLILRDPNAPEGGRWRFFVQPERMDLADPEALAIGRFHERTANLTGPDREAWWTPGERTGWTNPETLASGLGFLLDGAVLIGSNVQFDMRMLRRFLARHGRKLTCHYRPVDIGALAYGYLCGQDRKPAGGLPWSTTELAKTLGIDRVGIHEALPDAQFTCDVFDAVTGGAA